MNIENIGSLAEALKRVGVGGNITKELLQHVCFLPGAFTLVKRLCKEKDMVTCSFQFVRVKEAYVCSYYEVALMKNIEVPDSIIGSVHVRDLDTRMAAINWNAEGCHNSDVNLQDAATWKSEREIEAVIKDLATLSSSDEGKYFADAFRVKHWSYGVVNPLLGNLNSLRVKFEIAQRFYFMEGHAISIEEAYRFLLNKWMEKQQQLARKQPAGSINGVSPGESLDPAGERNLLPKKNKNRKGKLKS